MPTGYVIFKYWFSENRATKLKVSESKCNLICELKPALLPFVSLIINVIPGLRRYLEGNQRSFREGIFGPWVHVKY